jgi:hypothetical protein
VSASNPRRPKIAPSCGFLVEQGMEELDQLELAVDELMQGMKDLDQLELIVDEVLQWMEGMEELNQLEHAVDELLQGVEELKSFQYLRPSAEMQRMEELEQRELAIDVEGVAAGHGGPQARLAAEA